jgi:pSer/pThr/pTyr-binding forkhead associated (FHA) protein
VRQQYEDGSYGYQIIDGDPKGQPSSNGILVNGCRIQVHDLKHQDKIEFGSGVSATYLKQGDKKTGPLDPFDITLIDPSRVDEDVEEEEALRKKEKEGEIDDSRHRGRISRD